jgi:Mn2+/Fe2+ NRAMP family transporter
MGSLVNRQVTTVVASLVAAVIIVMNVILLSFTVLA